MGGRPRDIRAAVDFLFILIVLLGAAFWAWKQYMTSPPYVDPILYPVRGIDISAHQGSVNFKGVRDSGIEFVWIKATEGSMFRDTGFRLNYDKARDAGLKVGAYHYFRFDEDGLAQGVHFLRTIGGRELDMGVAVDVEDEGNARGVPLDTIKARLRDMTEYLNMCGYRVTFYSNRDGFYDYLMPEMEGMPMWLCSFSSDTAGGDFAFWQYSHSGKVPGINGKVDLNAFGGNREEWRQFLIDAKKPATRPPSN